jgi:hypothetical protein
MRDPGRAELAILLLRMLQDEDEDLVVDRLDRAADAESRRLPTACASRFGEGVAGFAAQPATAFPAEAPASRPKTAPAINPVPPG